jgi:hypothetical protein
MKQRSLTLNNNNFANFLEVCIISSLYFSHMKFCCMTYIMVNFLELYLITVETLVCVHLLILVDQFCIMFYPCPSVFPSVMFWFPFNNLSLPWTLSKVLKFVCVKNHKRSVNFDLIKSGASVSHVHLFFPFYYIFCW